MTKVLSESKVVCAITDTSPMGFQITNYYYSQGACLLIYLIKLITVILAA